MKKINVKTKTIIWMIATIVAILLLIMGSIFVYNANFVIQVSKIVDLNPAFVKDAYTKLSYGIGLIFFSIITCLVGGYISYAGIKSWNYSAVL